MSERDRLKKTIARELRERDEILFAFLFGSFVVPNVPFRDIDVGVFVEANADSTIDRLHYEANLSSELSKKVGYEVDVHVINDAPIPFAHSVVQGEVLLCRHERTLGDYVERVATGWCAFEHLYREISPDVFGK